ncbi:MAG: hypothetical protein IT273_04280 [Chitinophagales bacterium]|nr:hypothetical protein [Chitinophagales bacterium]
MKTLFLGVVLLVVANSILCAQINTFDNNVILEPGISCPTGSEVTIAQNQAAEDVLLEMINALRAQNSLPPLGKSAALTEAARYHAKDMCDFNYFNHASQDGNGNTVCTPFSRIGAFYAWLAAAENICAGYTTPTGAFEAWAQSQGHLNNMLSTNVYEIGIAYFSSPTAQYGSRWVMNVGKKNNIYPVILNGEALTATATPLSLYTYGSGVFTEMRTKINNGAWSSWLPFATNSEVDIAGMSDGLCTVSVEMRNASGSITAAASDQITLDLGATTPPPAVTILVKAKAMLQGCFNTTNSLMTTHLQQNSILPTAQPFNTSPWNYAGNETMSAIPSNMVDWVLLEVRSSSDNSQIVAQKAALLLNNGSIIDASGNPAGVVFNGLTNNATYYLSLKTRHHLAVLGSNSVQLPNATPYDFTDTDQVVDGSQQLYLATPDIGTLRAGDMDNNGTITVSDFNLLQAQSGQINVYNNSDCNLDRSTTVADFNLYALNISKIGVAQIRY